MRSKEEQRDIVPSQKARDITDVLIARYGLLWAVEIGQHIQAQLGAAVEQQKRLHPEDWVQPAQPEPTPTKKTLTMPRIEA